MSEPSERLTLAAIGDLHVTATGERSYRELFAEISEQADVLALCGDLTDLGRKDEAVDTYRKGIEVATRRGDQHARRELEAALAEIAPA